MSIHQFPAAWQRMPISDERSRVQRQLATSPTGSGAPRRRVPFLCLSKEKEPKERTPETSAPRLAARAGEPALLTCSGSRRHGVPAVTALDWPSLASRPTARAALLGADVTGGNRIPRCARPSPPTPLPHAGEGGFGFSLFGPLRKRRVGCRAQWGARQDVEQASSGPRFLCGRPVDASPEHGAPAGDRSRSERRGRWGVLSLGHVSLDKQRKVPRGRKAAKPAAKLTTGTPEPRHLLGTSKIDTPRNKA